MKAIVYHTYGSPDVLRCEEVTRPTPGAEEVVVRVRSAGMNPLDVGLMKGRPYLVRLFFGWPHPRLTRPGRDMAGVVESVGMAVTRFSPGDRVFGLCSGRTLMEKADGALAEYVRTHESALAKMPENLTYEQAAAVAIAGLTALQALRDKARIQPGHRVLINGAAGGVGSFAVQIARALGGDVTGVCSTRNVEMVRCLGASHVVDYTRDDFTRGDQRFDAIIDCITNRSVIACGRVMKPRSVYVGVGGPHGPFFGALVRILTSLFVAVALSPFANRKLIIFMMKVSYKDLDTLADLLRAGTVMPVIHRVYPLSEVADAFRLMDAGHVPGKLVVTFDNDEPRQG